MVVLYRRFGGNLWVQSLRVKKSNNNGSSAPTFRGNLSAQYSRVKRYGTTIKRCGKFEKRADLIYMAATARNHTDDAVYSLDVTHLTSPERWFPVPWKQDLQPVNKKKKTGIAVLCMVVLYSAQRDETK